MTLKTRSLKVSGKWYHSIDWVLFPVNYFDPDFRFTPFLKLTISKMLRT